MSEYVELMLDGVICEECGSVLGDAVGYPRKCSACSESFGSQGEEDGGDMSHPFEGENSDWERPSVPAQGPPGEDVE